MAPVFEYVSDEEHHEMVFIESEDESDAETVENMKYDDPMPTSFAYPRMYVTGTWLRA